MSKQVNYNENLCAGAAIRDDKGRRISKLFEASHPKMTVGYAKNLIMPDTPTEQEFNFRQAGGGVIEDGVAVIDKVKGNSVVWNQWEVKQTAENSSEEWDGSKMFWGANIVSGSLSFNEDSSIISYSFNDNGGFFRGHKGIGYIVGHKYVILVNAKANTSYLTLTNGDNGVNHSGSGNWELMSLFFTATTDSYTNIGLRLSGETSFPQAISQSQWKTIDLTQMFGAGNEPTTYEEFLQRKPKVADEYAYNEGTIVNNKVEKMVTTGINLWDEQWELGGYNHLNGKKKPEPDKYRSKNFIPVLSGKDYFWAQQNKTYKRINFYDANRNFISYTNAFTNQVFTTPINCAYITIWQDGTTYNHDLCINISDPTINGKYFPYEEHALDLAWVKEIKDGEGVKLFEDGMRSAGTAFDEVGKNKAVKRLGVKVLDGTEAFGRFRYSDGFWYFRLDVSTWGTIVGTQYLCNKYVYKGIGTGLLDKDKTIASYYESALCLIRDDSFENVDSFKQHLADLYAAGTPLVVYYELAEPIEVEYDEKSLTYPVVAGGTEEAIASEPSSAFRADIGYGIDAVKTILDLKARVEALEGK